jgi:glycosyltransferase involved in cell wall biosynthesis
MFAIKNLSTAKGGAEKVLAVVASLLVGMGHDVTIVTFDPPHAGSFYPLHDHVRLVGLGVGDVTRPSGVLDTIKRIIALRHYIKGERPKILIPFMHSMIIPLVIAVIGLKIPVIASEHIVPDYYKNRRLQYILFCITCLFVKCVTVLSAPIAALYPSFLQSKMVIMPNPVQVNVDLLPRNPQNIILNIGRLSAQKDQATLIHAFARIHAAYPDWNLRIVGQGEEETTLAALIQHYDLQGKITLVGAVSPIEAEYATAGLFVMSSRYESFGLATAEAMCFGIPVMGFADCAGTNEVIQHQKNGILIDPKTDRIEPLAEGMAWAIENPKTTQSMAIQAKQDVKQYHPDLITQKWAALIADLQK